MNSWRKPIVIVSPDCFLLLVAMPATDKEPWPWQTIEYSCVDDDSDNDPPQKRRRTESDPDPYNDETLMMTPEAKCTKTSWYDIVCHFTSWHRQWSWLHRPGGNRIQDQHNADKYQLQLRHSTSGSKQTRVQLEPSESRGGDKRTTVSTWRVR